MFAAARLRNFDDLTGWIGISQRSVDDVGPVALSLFLVIAPTTPGLPCRYFPAGGLKQVGV
jgi:ESS family glutamate:Na+ symporter